MQRLDGLIDSIFYIFKQMAFAVSALSTAIGQLSLIQINELMHFFSSFARLLFRLSRSNGQGCHDQRDVFKLVFREPTRTKFFSS